MVKVDFVSCGHFHDLMGYRKKGDQSTAKRLELIRGRDISSSEKRRVT